MGTLIRKIIPMAVVICIAIYLINKEPAIEQPKIFTLEKNNVQSEQVSPINPLATLDHSTIDPAMSGAVAISYQYDENNKTHRSEKIVIGEFLDPDDANLQYGTSGVQVIQGEYIDPDFPPSSQESRSERLVIGEHIDPEDTAISYGSPGKQIVMGEPIDPENTAYTDSANNERVILGAQREPEM